MKIRKMENRHRISDQLWETRERVIPKYPNTHGFGGGRPRVPDRQASDDLSENTELRYAKKNDYGRDIRC